jgi:hypothetical protein
MEQSTKQTRAPREAESRNVLRIDQKHGVRQRHCLAQTIVRVGHIAGYV